ncbi:PAS domain-containing sensor histidine kinase [Rufibacter psychrotolerans]|uniref:PAS domain-containing sensor histidine kinase n=1 Tax=Rufibacter psychrotolerans TaxID=2812556 RepID=UPI001966F75D|nr:PAS domain S-box protein [Rufibacter sp. SYSU D00308]
MNDIEKETKAEVWGRLAYLSPDLLCTADESGNFVHVNGACESILGYTKGELIGLNYAELLLPEDYPSTDRAIRGLRTDPRLTSFENRYVHRDGRTIHMMWSLTWSDTDGMIYAIGRDITEMKVARLRLQQSEQHYRSLFDQNPDIIFLEGRDGLVTKVNDCFASTLGLAGEDVVGKGASSFLPGETAMVAERSLQAALRGDTLRCDMEMVTAGGERRTFDTVKLPVKANGQVIGVQTIAKDITPMLRAYETIQRQARKLETIFESISDGFFTLDWEWNFTSVNREAERLLGLDRGYHLGRNAWEEFPSELNGEFYRQYHQIAQTGESAYFEAYFSGTGRWLEVKAYPSSEGLSIYFADITEKVRYRKELERLSLVASKANNGVIIADRDWNIEWVNAGFTRLTGYSLEEASGRQPSELMRSSEASRKSFASLEGRLLSGEPISFEVLNLKKTGEEVWLSVEINAVFEEEGRITGFIEIQTDITALKRSEQELTEVAKDLYRQNRDLQQFTYIVSHNLRAPVANIQGLAEALASAPRDPDRFGTSLSYLRESVLRLDMVLRDMNTILSIREGKGALQQEEVDLGLVLGQALASFQGQLGEIGGQVVNGIAGGTNIRANRAYLYSVFHNLISNAIKYRGEGTQLRIRVTCYPGAGEGVFISLSDNGSGFDMGKAGKDVFKLYKRFHRGREGRGLGLFMVKNQVEAMGGHIEVSSKVGLGTRFLIYLPKG